MPTKWSQPKPPTTVTKPIKKKPNNPKLQTNRQPTTTTRSTNHQRRQCSCFHFQRWPGWWRSGPWWTVTSSGPSKAWGHCSASGALAPSTSSSSTSSIRQPIGNPPPQLDHQTTKGARLPGRRGFVGYAMGLDRRCFDLWIGVASIVLSTLSLWVCVLCFMVCCDVGLVDQLCFGGSGLI